MIAIRLSNVHFEGAGFLSRAYVENMFQGTISISDSKGVVYREVLFPALELAAQMHVWLLACDGKEFRFSTASSDIVGLVRIRPEGNRWVIGSCEVGVRDSEAVEWMEIASVVESFISDVADRLDERGFDPRFYLYAPWEQTSMLKPRVPCGCYFSEPCTMCLERK